MACSAIESIRLLKLSAKLDAGFDGAINQNDLLGHYFMTHCFGGASALLPDRYDKSKALDADWATDCCATDDFLQVKRTLGRRRALQQHVRSSAAAFALPHDGRARSRQPLGMALRTRPACTARGFIDYLDNAFGRGLSVSFMANQVPQHDNRIELHPTVTDKWNRPVAYIRRAGTRTTST